MSKTPYREPCGTCNPKPGLESWRCDECLAIEDALANYLALRSPCEERVVDPCAAGAPGSVPGAISPASCCERTPKGSTAKRTVNQIVRYIAAARGSENGIRSFLFRLATLSRNGLPRW